MKDRIKNKKTFKNKIFFYQFLNMIPHHTKKKNSLVVNSVSLALSQIRVEKCCWPPEPIDWLWLLELPF